MPSAITSIEEPETHVIVCTFVAPGQVPQPPQVPAMPSILVKPLVPHFKVGDFIDVRLGFDHVYHGKFVLGFIEKVVPISARDAKYYYCNVDEPGVYGITDTYDAVCPPFAPDPETIRYWWLEPEFSVPRLKQIAAGSPSEHSPRPVYSPFDWETDPIYLATKNKGGASPVYFESKPVYSAKKTESPASPDAGPAKKTKKSSAAPPDAGPVKKTRKTTPFQAYRGVSPDGGCAYLRWGDSSTPPLPSSPDETEYPTARATTEEELICHEDFKSCMSALP